MELATLYFHIPYCKQACTYCDFHFSTNRKTEASVLDAMVQELEQRRGVAPWNAVRLKSIYFGGGTPSLLGEADLQRLLNKAFELFEVEPDAEITLEANPDDITPEILEVWSALGVNRLSVGIQSFHQEELAACNRAHSAAEARQALEWIRSSSIAEFSMDLIYGMPGSTPERWAENLALTASFAPDHLSCYSLTVEERTALFHQVEQGRIELPDEASWEAQYEALRSWAAREGYEQYELSNFARDGKYSRHNKHYWSYGPYLGIGPGAHSFDGEQRFWNISNNTLYAQGASTQTERLSPTEQFNERLMVRLRTAAGFDLKSDVPSGLSKEELERWKPQLDTAISLGSVKLHEGRLFIPAAGWTTSDHTISELFLSHDL